MKKTKRFFGQSRLLLFAITFVCVCGLVWTAANLPKKVVRSQERMIELADSPVRILLNGNDSYRISLDGKNFSRELPQRNFIRVRGHVFDPLVNPPLAMTTEAPAGRNLYIVQCVTQAIEAYQKQITAIGGEICGTMPDHALIVEMSWETSRKVQGMPFVRWVGVYQTSFKLVGLEDNASRVMSADKTDYSLWLTKKTKKKEVADFITSIGGEVILKTKGRRMEAKLDQGQLQQVAAQPQVLAIDLCTPKEEDMNNARDIGGADYIETVQGYTGQGVRAEVCDGGVRTTHVDFQVTPIMMHAGNSSSTSHGTPVTGIVFGSGTGEAIARGMLPNAEQPIFSCYNCFTDRYVLTQELVDPAGPYRAVFQTNSWGNTRTFFYTTISAEMDEIIFDLDIIITQSQSNAGNQDSRPQAWAKNIVSVGGVRHYDTLTKTDDCWCSGASIGPAADGRIKPDVWHFYDYIRTTYYSSDTAYTNTFGGTSGATPITAGHMGLIFQMWADGVFAGGPGLGRDVFDSRPHFTTAKALLIHSAYQYPFSGTSHDWTRMHQGWGMADVGNLYDLAQAHNWSFPVLIDESAVIAPLGTHTYNVNVTTGTDSLKATLVYADPAGVPLAAVHRINDLSLKVTEPNG
ncbi:MAG: S8 family serine peptidase, partial [Candidatus Aminicenantes bacterium]